eukprot:TRINITY_DN20218_c0_g1_i2.p1 TRINITY_DN20218_c0_g1~~TRINITY_DN20218_c0_g1_i2.p1  ORF type:complete len:102 (+),score=18.90 TRINITY_DN20218_c0_g1_i2:108-413(+)
MGFQFFLFAMVGNTVFAFQSFKKVPTEFAVLFDLYGLSFVTRSGRSDVFKQITDYQFRGMTPRAFANYSSLEEKYGLGKLTHFDSEEFHASAFQDQEDQYE